MKLKRIICMALSLTAVVCMLLINDSVAWIDTGSGEPVEQSITVDKMFFEFSGSLGTPLDLDEDPGTTDDKYIVAGQNLIVDNEGKITGVNHSTIATEVRVLIQYDTLDLQDVEYNGSGDMAVVFDDGWVKGASDNYFYKSFAAVPAENSVVGTAFDVLEGLFYDVTTAYSAASADVTITIQAKQEDYVDWTTITSIISGS